MRLAGGRARSWRLGLALGGFFAASCLLFGWLEREQGLSPLDVAYWWITTSTTVGYGDITPRTQGGKLLVILVVLAGVSVVAAVAAQAGGALLQRRLLQWRGLGRMDHLRGHTVVCGWSDDLEGILHSLAAHGQARRSTDIALVSTRDADRLATLRTRPELQDLHIISGDSTRAADLERAGAARAAKALVLAEEGDPAPDSRTLLTVMAFRQLNKEAHLCAEVREQRFVRYVRDAGADELIDPGAFRRALAAQILVSPGMGNVFYHLLRLDKGASFGLEDVPADLEGRTFADLARLYLEREGVMLVGLVENVGNPLQVKRDALREAQRTPDVDQLVDRLREAKQVEPHHPVLCPPPGHVLRPRTQAVVVRRSEGTRP